MEAERGGVVVNIRSKQMYIGSILDNRPRGGGEMNDDENRN